MTVTVIHKGIGRKVPSAPGESVKTVLERADAEIFMPCAGRGICGKCRVKISGGVLPPDKTEQRKLTSQELSAGVRLACRAKLYADAEITTLSEKNSFHGEGGFSDISAEKPMTGEKSCVAAAVDIGTTSVAFAVYKMPEFTPLGQGVFTNPQARHGADVISRIEFAVSGGAEALKNEIHSALAQALGAYEPVSFYVVTGNTCMLHFYEGLSTAGFSKAPFHAESLFGEAHGSTYFPDCVSPFVGADITCGVLSSGMLGYDRSLLIDLGTNGEMAFYKDGRLYCCSTAAGPVFEGAGISMGMTACDGAVNSVNFVSGQINYTVLGGKKAVGICGSGVIDAVRVLLESGETDESGYMEESFEIGSSGVYITPADVRAVQLAKSAIRAGLETLTAGETVSRVYIAGGFGRYVSVESLILIGMLPKWAANKTYIAGNAALAGAEMLLADSGNAQLLREIAATAVSVPLASDAVFREKFIEYMAF